MDSRSKILDALKVQVKTNVLRLEKLAAQEVNCVDKFKEVLVSIGGKVVECENLEMVSDYITRNFEPQRKIFSTIKLDQPASTLDSARFEDVELVVLKAKLGVAENGAVWITDDAIPDRVMPFITQHLMILVDRVNIVSTLGDAYEIIGNSGYEFGTFIAGPSKTADIEQALVLGAHGAKTMTVLIC